MKKLNGSAATYFNNFYKGLTKPEICELIENSFIKGVQSGMLNPSNKEEYMKYELRELAEAEAYFSKVKLDNPQTFRINPWGYEQINYENLTVIGHIRSSLVVLMNYNVYSVSKAKYNKREKFTQLDSVRSTSWEPAYTNKELADQAEYNAYYGH